MAEESQYTGAAGGAAQGAATGAAFGPWGAVIGGVVGGVAGFLGGGGEKKAKKLAKQQAAEILRVARESTRRQERQARFQVGTAKAATYASNIMDTGSSRQYRTAMESEYRRQIQFDIDTANASANAAIQGGKNAASAIKSAGWGQLLGGIGSFGAATAGGAFASTASTSGSGIGSGEVASRKTEKAWRKSDFGSPGIGQDGGWKEF